MIDLYQLNTLRNLRHQTGEVLCLGDQRPSAATGFKTTSELFGSLGYTGVIDIDYNGKAEINHDLNYPIPTHLHDRFTLVYDGGTCEHVCNIGQALSSMVLACRLDGLVVQESPIVPYGQQYFGIDPQVQRDFFFANGFVRLAQRCHYRRSLRMKVLHLVCRLLPRPLLDKVRSQVKNVPRAKEFIFADTQGDLYEYPTAFEDRECYYVHPQTRTLYVGKKVHSYSNIVWPAMGCYPKSE